MPDEINVVLNEPKTFKQTLKPVIYFCWLMGTGVCRPNEWKKLTIFIKFFHFSMCSVIVAYGIIDFFAFGNILKGEMFKMIYYTNKAVVYVTSYYYVIFGFFFFKRWEKFVERFDSIDRKLRREIMVNDRTVKIQQIVALSFTILMGPMATLMHVAYYLITDPEQIYTSDLIFYYTIAQSLTTNFGFDVMVYRIYQRFKIVNKLIKQIGDSYSAPWIVLKIQRLRELHYGVCNLVNIMNDFHGVHLLLSSANSFMMVVATLFRIYIGVVEGKFQFIVINNVIWMVYAAQFAINCYVCTLAVQESIRTGILIHEVSLKNNQLTNKRLYSNNSGNRRSLNYQTDSKTYEGSCVQNEIAHFSSQLEHNRVVFNACGFFVLNNALLQGFIGVITTYLIILIQFYHPPDEEPHSTTKTTNLMNADITTEEYYTASTMSEKNYSLSY